METGIIADIQRFSLHDGPGIRTSVFVKGCNMRCAWCHNPETIDPAPEILRNMENCIGCGQCEDGCFADAKVLCGREMTVAEVVAQAMLDAPYYGKTGGITITGGEPACQAGFCAAVLSECRNRGVHTAIETNMLASWDEMETLLAATDLVMADLKIFDNEKHRRWTGADNALIKENIIKVSERGIPLIVRTPVVPGANDDPADIAAIAAFADGLPTLEYYELLPYHSLGLSKGKVEHWEYARFRPPEPALMREMGEAASAHCRNVRIAGKALRAKTYGEGSV